MLHLLQRLCDHLSECGWDDTAAQAARDVMRYFDLAAPLHHEDEELHVFPALLAAPDIDGLHAVVQRLQQDHVIMVGEWERARQVLGRIHHPSDAPWQPLATQETTALTHFASLYAAHIEAEERLVYPMAQTCIPGAELRAMGQDMKARRGAA